MESAGSIIDHDALEEQSDPHPHPFTTWGIAWLLLVGVGCTAKVEGARPADAQKAIQATGATSSPEEAAMLHNKLGGLLLLLGDLHGAHREFRSAIRLSPESPAPHNNLGMVLLALGDSPGAIEEFSTAIRLSPDHAAARSNLGFALFDRGELDPAIEQWRSAVSLDPSLAGAWAGLALGFFVSGCVDQALQSYRRALQLDARYADVNYLRFARRWSVVALEQARTILRLLEAPQMIPGRNAGT